MDDWQTTSEVACQYSASLPALPPPFSATGSSFGGGGGENYANASPTANPMSGYFGGHSKSASMTSIPSGVPPSGKVDSWDRFTFTIKLEDVERTLVNKKIFFVVR